MADLWQLQFLMGKVIFDREFRANFLTDPQTAAKEAGIHLTKEQVEQINQITKTVDPAKLNILPDRVY